MSWFPGGWPALIAAIVGGLFATALIWAVINKRSQ